MNDDLKELTRNLIYDETVKGFICTDEFYKGLKDYIINLQQKYNDNVTKYEELLEKYFSTKQRIDKASEYILDHHPDNTILPQGFYAELLEILQGESNE